MFSCVTRINGRMSATRKLISSGTIWEKKYGYSRAVLVGDRVFVAGTTAVDESGAVIGDGSPYEQARVIYQKNDRALRGASALVSEGVRGGTIRYRCD